MKIYIVLCRLVVPGSDQEWVTIGAYSSREKAQAAIPVFIANFHQIHNFTREKVEYDEDDFQIDESELDAEPRHEWENFSEEFPGLELTK